MKRYVIYLSGVALLAVVLLIDLFSASLLETTRVSGVGEFALHLALPMVIILLAHGPAILTVATQNSILGRPSGIMGRYPEVIVPVLLLASWVMTGLTRQMPLSIFVSGITSAAAIAVCYAAVRLVVAYSTKSARLSSHVPGFSSAALGRVGAKGIYLMRVLVAAASLFVLTQYLITGRNAVWLPVFAIAIIGIAALLALLSIQAETALARRAAKTASQALAAQLASRPTDVALYYSGPVASKHLAPVQLAGRLAKEGILSVIIARESGAQKALAKAPNRHLWLLPTIDTLDAAAQPELRVVFYINDAAKNGHFIRFNNYSHVLMATGSLVDSVVLPRSCAMYDAIIAPDAAKADMWRAAADVELAKRIVTVGPIEASESTYEVAQTYPPSTPLLTLHLGAVPQGAANGETDLSAFRDMLPNLVKTVAASKQARLQIWFSPPEIGARGVILRILHRDAERAIQSTLVYDEDGNVEDPLVSILIGTPADAANAADFAIVTTASDLNALYNTGKPLLWFDPAPAPEGVSSIGTTANDYAKALQSAWDGAASPAPSSILRSVDSNHFESFAELISAMKVAKNPAPQEGEPSC